MKSDARARAQVTVDREHLARGEVERVGEILGALLASDRMTSEASLRRRITLA